MLTSKFVYDFSDKQTLLGESIYYGSVTMGQPMTAFAPALTQLSENAFDVFGRDVYISQLYDLLKSTK